MTGRHRCAAFEHARSERWEDVGKKLPHTSTSSQQVIHPEVRTIRHRETTPVMVKLRSRVHTFYLFFFIFIFLRTTFCAAVRLRTLAANTHKEACFVSRVLLSLRLPAVSGCFEAPFVSVGTNGAGRTATGSLRSRNRSTPWQPPTVQRSWFCCRVNKSQGGPMALGTPEPI